MSVPFRRMLAVALAGVVLGACSNAAEDATAPSTPDAAVGPESVLYFTVSSPSVFFNYVAGAFTQTTQTVDVSGRVVATTPYVRVLSVNYSPSNVKDWLTITQRPTLLADKTLGVRLTFTVRAVPGVESGATATVPITVPGARNGPQTITIFTNPLNCPISSVIPYPTPIGAMSYVLGEITSTDCMSPLIGGGGKLFDVYSITVPGDRRFQIDNRSSGSGAGTLSDAWIDLFDPVTGTVIASDDDSGAGLDSRMFVTNAPATPKLYYIVATHYGGIRYGTYRLEVTDLGTAVSSAPFLSVAAEPPTAAELAKKNKAPR